MREHILVLSWLFLAIPCQAGTITVKSDGSGDHPTIQAAIDAAEHGDTVIISPGTYTGEGNRDIDFKSKAITVRSIDPNDPNVVAATIIDCQGSEAELHRGFYLNGCSGARICGLTITNGYAEAGGGIYCANSEVTISRCVVTENATTEGAQGSCDPDTPGGRGGDGAGLYFSNSAANVFDCEIMSNTTGDGGGGSPTCGEHYATRGGDAGRGAGTCCVNSSELEIWDSDIVWNATGDGGDASFEALGGEGGSGAGIFCDQSSFLGIRKCLIGHNRTGKGGLNVAAPGYGDSRGGGLYCFSALVEDCNFIGNEAANWEDGYGSGGGMFVDDGNTVVCNCTFNRNLAESSGSGIHLRDGELLISACTVSRNAGDAITNSGGTLTLRQSRLTENGGEYPYPGYVISSSSGMLTLDDCIIAHNRGVGVRFSRGDGLISDCLIKDNLLGIRCNFGNLAIRHCMIEANGSRDGGTGISCYTDDTFTMSHCIITNNAGRHVGGGIYFSGGSNGKFSIHNCLIAGNRIYGSGSGGGVYCKKAVKPVMTHCTITGNWAKSVGGGIYCENEASPTVVNSIVWGNTAPLGTQIALATYSDPYAGIYSPSSIQVNYSTVEGGSAGVHVDPGSQLNWGVGNISLDPLFVQSGYWGNVNDLNVPVEPNHWSAVWVDGDYHLSQRAAGQATDSPCVDAGSDTAVNLGMNHLTTRTDKVGDESIVDIGYHYRENVADLNDDGKVDVADLAIFASQWQHQPGIPSADIAPTVGDGLVDDRDLRLLADNWLWQE